ncbi:MAG: hypothetical protein N4A71_02565 [Carboxylicivirga sp.]|jgi:hypothetical protein|nr:hypothetical protein [Carboxylicivirga sp.]
MILYYAPGGGLGHVSRALKLMQQWQFDNFRIITNSTAASHFIDSQQLIIIPKKEQNQAGQVLQALLSTERVLSFYIDTFPCGLAGELNNVTIPANIEVHYVCRRVKWNEYEKYLTTPPHFHSTYIFEEPEADQHSFIQKSSEQIKQILLNPINLSASKKSLIEQYNLPKKQPVWLITHSDNPTELTTLINYAKDIAQIEDCHPYLLVNTNIENVEFDADQLIFHYPSYDLFEICDRIFSACGFNLMHETQEYSDKHFFIPFDRKYDDQFWRANKRKALKK